MTDRKRLPGPCPCGGPLYGNEYRTFCLDCGADTTTEERRDGLCECGCGERTGTVAPETDKKAAYFGVPNRYVHPHAMKGVVVAAWKRRVEREGGDR